MSVRYLYEKPEVERFCSWCAEPIRRNICKTADGRLWHYGCLMNAKDTHYQCPECWADFDGTEANFEESTVADGNDWKRSRKALCSHCGAQVSFHDREGVIEI